MKATSLSLLIFFSVITFCPAQNSLSINTRIADALALLPAPDKASADRVYHELISLGDEGLLSLTGMVKPNGDPDGVAPRFAVALLTHHATKDDHRTMIEKVYLNAIEKSSDVEVKSYFIKNLEVIGSDRSVELLSKLVADRELAQPAISALEGIASDASRQALLAALVATQDAAIRARLIEALGDSGSRGAVSAIAKFVNDSDAIVKRNALWALASLGDANSYPVILNAAKQADFKRDNAESAEAFAYYLDRLVAGKQNALVLKASQEALSATLDPSQQHIRLAALNAMTKASPEESLKVLTKELNRFDPAYQKEVLKIAAPYAGRGGNLKMWSRLYRKSTPLKADILDMLALAHRDDKSFASNYLVPALKSKDATVRLVAAEALSYYEEPSHTQALTDYLKSAATEDEIAVAKEALLRTMGKDDVAKLASQIESATPAVKVALIDILSARRAVEGFPVISKQVSSDEKSVSKAAYAALPQVSSADNIDELLELLANANKDEEIAMVQSAIRAALDETSTPLVIAAYEKDKIRVLPLMPYVKDEQAFQRVASDFSSSDERTRTAAFDALTSWQDHGAVRMLLAIRKDPTMSQYHDRAFGAMVSQVMRSSWPDDQKLLILDEAMQHASTNEEKNTILRAVGNVRTFLALVFVSRYLDDPALNRAAGRSAMQIALPTADARPGLTGAFVRNTLTRILDKLEGQDSQYEVIDIQTYLANMPVTRGFEPIFNGKDLSGWQGLVENPIARSKMSREELAKKQQEADAKAKENWTVKDNAIWFSGKGDNLCTIRHYGDFEMICDWKISRDGDSGIYLRGSPQVQIWDPTSSVEATHVGSGGLFNNQKHRSTPLTVADNPIGEWNTFRIRMQGEMVTVYLNGVLVVDSVVMENYWDRSIPIFPSEAIELQAHGNELAFRNIYVKEIGGQTQQLSEAEKSEGFELLFNGKDLDNWMGNKTEYVVEDNAIAIYPQGEGHGNLLTKNEYSDFIFRFDFQLTPGANNGLGIHCAADSHAAYEGKEIQILDNTAPVYANLEPYQYHGSVYGLVPAKKGFLKPVGEWNQQEVYVKGDRIKVTLNGTVILDADLKEATKKGTMDKKEHPGLSRHRGHIAFLGHGTVVRFRNVRVREL